MIPNYRYAESTVCPETIQIDGDIVYLRKDISKLVREDGQGSKLLYWIYQEAVMTVEDFNKNANALIMLNQKANDDGQTVIMEALADMYETLAMSGL